MVQLKTYIISGKRKGADKMKKDKILFPLVLISIIVFITGTAIAGMYTKQCTDSLLDISNRTLANDGEIPNDISTNRMQSTAICSENICLGEKSQFSIWQRSAICWGSATLYREMGNYQKAIDLYRKGCDMGSDVACESLKELQTKIKSSQTQGDEKIVFVMTKRDGTRILVNVDKSHPAYKTIYEMTTSGSAHFEYMDCLAKLYDFVEGKRGAVLQVAQCSEIICLMHKDLLENDVLPSESAWAICHSSANMYSKLGNKGKSLSLHAFNCDVTEYLPSCLTSGIDYWIGGQEDKAGIYLEKACKHKYSQDEKDTHIAACGVLSSYKYDNRNYTEAVMLAKESCGKNVEDPKYRSGSALACKVLGYAYLLGNGVKANENQAMMYFRKACDLGLDDVCKKVR